MDDASSENCRTKVSGSVKFFDDAKGYGFIRPSGGGADVFVHRTGFVPPLEKLSPGDAVQYVIIDSPDPAKGDGKKAASVELVVVK